MTRLDLKSQAVRNAMSAKKYSYTRVARRLGVSAKTVQRWANGSAKRIRSDVLEELARVLSVSPELLTQCSQGRVRLGPVNELVRHFTSDEFYLRTYASGGWASYISALRGVSLESLPSHQEALVLVRLGAAQIAIGALSSAKEYFKRAKAQCLKLEDDDLLVMSESWLAHYKYVRGNLKKSLEILDDLDGKILSRVSDQTLANYYFTRGFIYLNVGKFEEGEASLRKTILLCYEDQQKNLLRIALAYPCLAWVYLRQRRYGKAKSAFRRSLDFAQQAGWPNGIAISNLAISVIDALKGNPLTPTEPNRARRMFQKTIGHRKDTRFDQLNLASFVLNGSFAEVRKILEKRKVTARGSRIFHAYFTKDSLLLSRLNQDFEAPSSSDAKKAIEFFEKNEMHRDLVTMNKALDAEKIDICEFFQGYSFF